MTSQGTNDYYRSLVEELVKLSVETEWVEFKHNRANPEEIGEYISALANSAALVNKVHAYVLWGIDDESHEIIGTGFRYKNAKVGNEELENWLLKLLAPKIRFDFHELNINGNTVCLLEVETAKRQPVQFKGQEFVRVGSYTKKLKEFPEKERELWRLFDATPFERQIAESHLPDTDVLQLLDYPAYFELLGLPMPGGTDGVISALAGDDLIVRDDAGRWNISNLGAVLFARDLNNFKTLERKAVRVVLYRGEGRIEAIREQVREKGYARGFGELISYINGLLASTEVIGEALRKELPMFPELAVRELVANALIHQDFTQSGNGPIVEIFDSRMEITNPGLPLVNTERFLDAPPKSRNEALASLLRRIGICEERGSGIDKVVFQTELYQLPAPSFETVEGSTKTVLFAHKELSDMDKSEKVRACYLHACLRFVERQPMTNASLRERFKVETRNRATISRIISDTLGSGLILPSDPDQGRRHASYVPYWAGVLNQNRPAI